MEGWPALVRAVIFDMDGLLLDSEVYWEQARAGYCRSMGCTWAPDDELSVKGHNSPEWAKKIRRHCKLESDWTEIVTGVTSRMRALYDHRLPLLPGALSVVREVAARYPCAIASSSPPELIDMVVSRAGIQECFTALVSADTTGRGKPAPDVFLAAARELKTDPPTIAVFEDSGAGIRAGRAAGMVVIAVPNPHYPPPDDLLSEADIVLPSLLDFRLDMLSKR
jgi:HAD superfamily hydrolase (TIGR01509 family)